MGSVTSSVTGGLAAAVEKVLGRRFLWRLGRGLYLAARRESANDIGTNGERVVQRAALLSAQAAGRPAVVIDVGANYGQWASALVATATQIEAPLRLISFEPVPEIHSALETLFRSFPESRNLSVSARRMALADRPQMARFSVMEEGSGTHHLQIDDRVFDNPRRTIEVEVSTIDILLAKERIEFVDLLKIDCEGFDPLVLKGALESLRESRIGAIQFEYNHRWTQSRHFLYDIFQLIADLPYALSKITPTGLELYHRWQPEMERFIEANYLLTHQDHVAHYPVRRVFFDSTNTHS